MNTLDRLRALGYEVHLEGDEIVCRWQGAGKPPAAQVGPLVQELRERKPEAVAWLQADECLPVDLANWPESWGGLYEERAAIIEFDGGLKHSHAKRLAEELVRAAYLCDG